ncbi:hypothetical protein [Agarivorans sp. B2Z047]|nr:hypothetical protein [Agarivorans sp. B2Z047]UQN43735.1 hypothetical protein LQZ07_04495 [Agarivorans sp. B2Z047]
MQFSSACFDAFSCSFALVLILEASDYDQPDDFTSETYLGLSRKTYP